MLASAMDGLSIGQFVITAAGTIILPGIALYVNAQIDKRLSQFEVKLSEKLEKFTKQHYERVEESNNIHANLSQRLAVVENGHNSISDRLDSLFRELRAESVAREHMNQRPHHP